MKLQTQIPLKKETKNLINYDSNIFLLGSCFSENIGNKLSHFKFQSIQNPFGILFHPKAIETLITNAVNQKVYSSEDVFLQNEVWHSFVSVAALITPPISKNSSVSITLWSLLNLNTP